MAATITRDQNRLNGAVYSDTETLFDSDNDDSSRERIGVATGAEQLIFGMLSDLSMNRGAYVLREAYSNAYDATKATGSMDGEINITVPTSITTSPNPTSAGIAAKLAEQNAIGKHAIVCISDNGIGMTERDVRRYFLQYGGSKKRDDIDAIGSKGLGAKAPLSVSDMFEVRSRKDGIETTASIIRNGSACYAKVTTRKTSKGNGTDVLIPVNDVEVLRQMAECANTLASVNIDANLVINGKPAKCLMDGDSSMMQLVGRTSIGVDENGDDVEADVFWYGGMRHEYPRLPKSTYSNINVIVGGYPYSLSNAVRGHGAGTSDLQVCGWYVTCDPGYLNFTPSRDAIRSDEHAKTLLDNITDAIDGINMSDFLIRMIDAASVGEKLALLEDCTVFDGYLSWARDESGNVLGFSTDKAFTHWHAYISAEHLYYKGINLVSITKHNDVMHSGNRDVYDDKAHADLGDGKLFTLMHAYNRNTGWTINRYYKHDYKNDALSSINASCGSTFSGHWTDIIASHFNLYSNVSRYAVIITDCNGHEDCASTAMRSILAIFRSCFPSFTGGVSGDRIAMVLMNDGLDSCIGEAEMDIINAAYDGNVIVKSWDEMMRNVKEYRKNASNSASTRAKHVGDSTTYDFDLSGVSNAIECMSTVNDRCAYGIAHTIGRIDAACGGYDNIAFAFIDNIGYGSYVKGAAFAIGVMMLNGAFPKNVRRACVLADPYADDIVDITRRGGIIAFDVRNKRKQHAHAIVNPGDGYKYGIAIDDSAGRSILIDGNDVYADNDKATMTYLAINSDDRTTSGLYKRAVMTCITEGFLENTPLDGMFDPQYDQHINADSINDIGYMPGASITHDRSKKYDKYGNGIHLIAKAIELGRLSDLISHYAYPYDISADGKDVYDVFRSGIVTAFRKSLGKVMKDDGKRD